MLTGTFKSGSAEEVKIFRSGANTAGPITKIIIHVLLCIRLDTVQYVLQ